MILLIGFWQLVQGVFVSGLSYCLQIWCLEKKGPVYVAMFSPLSVLVTAIVSALIWAELLYFGRFACFKELDEEKLDFLGFSFSFLLFLLGLCCWFVHV